MTEHIAARELERYVIGALDDVSVARVDAHVASCDACMRALSREAALEMAFEAVARGEAAPSKVASLGRARSARAVAIACAVGGALSLAAAWMLWVMPAERGAASSIDTPAEQDATTASLDSAWRDRVLDGG